MAIAKQFLKSKPVCKVTFSLAADAVAEANNVALLGEFNGWDLATATTLKKQKDGSYKATVELESGKEYQFRYLLDGASWTNDGEADKYVPSGVSYDENSVVVL
jgi:1,4-alpha-glucan branching enzyme